jgi:molybdopterin converting factor small subunit
MPVEPGAGAVTVRYWAGARAAAGVDEDALTGCATVGEALVEVVRLRPAVSPVVAVSTILLDGRVAQRDLPLVPGAVLEVLPPFAGG